MDSGQIKSTTVTGLMAVAFAVFAASAAWWLFTDGIVIVVFLLGYAAGLGVSLFVISEERLARGDWSGFALAGAITFVLAHHLIL